MDKEQELRPCPLCRSVDVYSENTITQAVVRCRSCGLTLTRHNGRNANEGLPVVIADWNRRSPDEQAEVAGWRHPEAGWVSLNRAEVAMHSRKDGPQPVPLYASPPAVAKGGVTEDVRGAVKKAIRAALTDRMTDSANASSWDADMLLAGCTHYLGLGYEKPAEAADKLASDATEAAISILTAALAVGDEGIREGWRHDHPFITSTSARPEYYVTVKVRDIKALHDAHDIVLRAFSEAVRLGGSNADQN